MNLKRVSEIVEKILRHEPDTRCSDELLILKVWAYQNGDLRKKDYCFRDFAIGFMDGNYFKTESIRRSRQKIQEHNPELRGENHNKRQYHQEDVKEELRDIAKNQS